MYEKVKVRHGSPEWLALRMKGIGASDAAAILGLSNWKTNQELWEEKVGLRQRKEVSNPERVAYGQAAEKHLVALFKLQYADRYKVRVDKNVVYFRNGFQFASLDGELTELETGNKGVHEDKTVLADSSLVWEEWKDKIPNTYYVQVVHQLLVTGWKFVIINPEFRWLDKNGEIATRTRRIKILAEEVAEDMKILDEAEHEFWGYVQRKERPPRVLPQI